MKINQENLYVDIARVWQKGMKVACFMHLAVTNGLTFFSLAVLEQTEMKRGQVPYFYTKLVAGIRSIT